MPSRPERSDKTAREMFLEQAAAYFDDLKITTESRMEKFQLNFYTPHLS